MKVDKPLSFPLLTMDETALKDEPDAVRRLWKETDKYLTFLSTHGSFEHELGEKIIERRNFNRFEEEVSYVVEEVETVPVLAPEDLYRKFDSVLKIGFVTNTQKRESKKWQSDLHDLFLKHATDMVLDKNYLMSENRQVLRFMIQGAELHQKKYEQKKPVAKPDKQEL